ncbi:MAG: hypothetical protein AAGU21_08345 [Solidesulfovibrio sp.]|uniref:hypothetical protein n=1 Tax=Solidesulfovibrio sp. TaxID=2910990 RepID=UPI0031580C76
MVCLGLGSLPAGSAWAQNRIGQLSRISGDVTYQAAQTNKQGKARPHLMVGPGDTFVLGQGAAVFITYCGSEREEVWRGPGTFTIQAGSGQECRELLPVDKPSPPSSPVIPLGVPKESSYSIGGCTILNDKQKKRFDE